MAAVILPPCFGVPASLAPPDAAGPDGAPLAGARPGGPLGGGVEPQAATTIRIVASRAAGRPPRRRKVCIGQAPQGDGRPRMDSTAEPGFYPPGRPRTTVAHV